MTPRMATQSAVAATRRIYREMGTSEQIELYEVAIKRMCTILIDTPTDGFRFSFMVIYFRINRFTNAFDCRNITAHLVGSN